MRFSFFRFAILFPVTFLAGCGSHIEEDRLPAMPPAMPPTKTDTGGQTGTGTDAKPLAGDGRATDDVRQAAEPAANGQGEGTCGVRLTLKADGKGDGQARYVLVAKVAPECAEGNDVLVSLRSQALVRPEGGAPCEISGVEAYEVMCRVTGALLAKNGEMAIPVRIEDRPAPAGGRGNTRVDVSRAPPVTAYAEFVPTESGD